VLLLVQYVRVFSALHEKPTVGRVRRSAAAKPGAYVDNAPRRGPKPSANPGNLSGRNHARASRGGTVMHPQQFRLVLRKVVRMARTYNSKTGLVKPTNPLVVVVVKQTQHQ
jgi:hypothetical protein